jgi:hypothetical protein
MAVSNIDVHGNALTGSRVLLVQIAHRDEYLILASATPPCSNVEEALPEGSPVQNVPVYASTTFHLVSLCLTH